MFFTCIILYKVIVFQRQWPQKNILELEMCLRKIAKTKASPPAFASSEDYLLSTGDNAKIR